MKRWKKCILLAGSLALLLLPKKIVNACGFYVTPGEYRFWLLQPDLTNQPDLTPFFFASTYLYRQNQYPLPDPSVQKNVDEWYQSIRRAASKTDIDSLLNRTDPEAFFDEGKKIARHNSFLRYLLRPQNKELYDYFVISKKIEQIAGDPNPWGDNRPPVAEINRVIEEARSLQQKTHSTFIQLRIAFQLIRLYNFNAQPALVAKEYNIHIAPVRTDSWIKTAALYQRAIYADSTEYEYLLSKVFDRGGYNRTGCLVRFRGRNTYEALQHARNAHERTVIYAMQVMNHPGRCLPYIRTIYHTEPGYKEIPFLLLREINKVEDWLVTNQVTDFDPATDPREGWWDVNNNKAINYGADKLYARKLQELIESIIREKKNKDTALLHLFAAHLSMLNKDYPVARHHLDQAKKQQKQPANVRFQIKVNSFLLDLQEAKNLDFATEQKLMGIMQTPAAQSGVYDYELMKDQLILYTARKLLGKGERAKGYLLLGKTRRAFGELRFHAGGTYKGIYQELEENATPDDYDGMIRILDKKNKTPFEKFVAQPKLYSAAEYYEYYDSADCKILNKSKLLDCKSTWYIRNNNLQAARSILRQIPDSFWKQEPYLTYIKGDPFFLNVYRAHRVTADDKQHYNKRELVAKMIWLQQLSLQGGPRAAEADFLLANAWYNISYYGKDWLVMKQWWSMGEMSSYNDDIQRNPFNDVYLGCNRAREHYLKALQKTKDKKLATLCCFMAGTCYNHFREYLWAVKNKGKHDAAGFKELPNPYRVSLKKKGVEDNYYREVVQECTVYTSWISAYNK